MRKRNTIILITHDNSIAVKAKTDCPICTTVKSSTTALPITPAAVVQPDEEGGMNL